MRLREQRKARHMTLEQFAEAVELSQNYLGDLERGVKQPSMDAFIRIVDYLKVPADLLIRDTVDSSSYVADAEISKKLSALTAPQKKAAIDILDAYLKNLPSLCK